ncbi:methyltransferase-like protein [Daldinia loculata]|uniref:methyltransferase-like protein n=1 Tax=Daldinia loculata TaxID=103429 RepID=UPI0020C5A42A|nr:methyltransferase-like protein [Daldinia loculata]KAI1643737.1 methyltransferase-like protein [Daldinia loculata]
MASTSTPTFEEVRKEYDDQAPSYNSLLKLPFGIFESQLFESAVRRDLFCQGSTVLDLGGGTGLRARQALEAGAAKVDVVDISIEMMEVGMKDTAVLMGPNESAKIRWFLGDASKPLFGQGGIAELQASYDVVMANWIFDHVDSLSVLDAIWRNIAAALRPGGRFIGVRACDPRTQAMVTGKYGPTCQDFAEFHGGLYYSSTIPDDSGPPVQLKNASLKISYTGSSEMYERYGFHRVEIEPCENTKVVRDDPEYWKLWVEHPGFVIVRAWKK